MPSIGAEAAPDYSDHLHVVVAVIDNGRDEVLLARRHDHLHQGGLWEFPGGKVESDEAVYDALKRELYEELAIELEQAHPLIRIPYEYPDRKVLLDVWLVTGFNGEPSGAEGQPFEWATKARLAAYEFPAANKPIITAALLPSSYLITPAPGPQSEWPSFLQQLEASLHNGVTLIQLRATDLDSESYLQLAHDVVELCHRYGARLLLNADVSLLEQCDADGIHLNSHRLQENTKRPVAGDKWLAASCHNIDELHHAQNIGVDFALLSPVKVTTTHPDAAPIGWQQFNVISEQCSIPLYALGGMSLRDLPDAWRYGAQGIAAIRSLWCGAGERPFTAQ